MFVYSVINVLYCSKNKKKLQHLKLNYFQMTGIYLIDIEYNRCVFAVCTLNVENLNICPPWKLIIKICRRTPQPHYRYPNPTDTIAFITTIPKTSPRSL